jgi:hypothetical protein
MRKCLLCDRMAKVRLCTICMSMIKSAIKKQKRIRRRKYANR